MYTVLNAKDINGDDVPSMLLFGTKHIPLDPCNRDYQEYKAKVAAAEIADLEVSAYEI